MSWKKHGYALLLISVASIGLLAGCEPSAQTTQTTNSAPALAAPITMQHQLGSTQLHYRPQRVAALDMNEVDFLAQLNIPISGMSKDYVPHFLAAYKNDPAIADLGAIVQPNLERVHALRPDLILITPIQATHYQALSEIAPTLHFDVDFSNSQNRHFEVVKAHLADLGKIFDKQELAQSKIAELDAKLAQVQQVTANRPEKALIVLHNNGAFSSFGVQSRYAFVFSQLGVKPASNALENSLHGQPISSEFIQQADPDILYIVDRTAVMERRPVIDAERLANPLLRQTKAWKNGKVVFVDADAWYTTGASVTSLKLMMDDIIKGYQP